MSEINMQEILQQVYSELVLKSEQDRLRAEGVQMVSDRLYAALVASSQKKKTIDGESDGSDEVAVS